LALSWAVVVALLATGCAPVAPTAPAASGGSATAAASPASGSGSPSPGGSDLPSSGTAAVDPGVARLVWLVDRAGGLGVWTTDLAGGDVRAYLAQLDEDGTSLRDAHLVGEDVVLIREAPSAPTAQLWVVSRTAPMRTLLDAVDRFVVSGEGEVLAVRDDGATRTIWRVPTAGAAPAVAIATVPLPAAGPELGPFGFAISPDGRTVAAGWVGGPVQVVGPAPATFRDLGAPLVVDDDGRIVAVTGRAGEAYLVDGDGLTALAPPDSDPLAILGSGVVAWPTIHDGTLSAIEIRDLLAGTSATYPASGVAMKVRELGPTYAILEATAFDPLSRTVGVLDRRGGGFTSFEAPAPAVD
jgi:hypothetical protein